MAGYRAELPPPDFNMAQYCLAPRAGRAADKLALAVLVNPDTSEPAESWTFGAFEDAVLRAAGGLLKLGLNPGDRVMIRLENTSSYALLFFGADCRWAHTPPRLGGAQRPRGRIPARRQRRVCYRPVWQPWPGRRPGP